MTEHTYDKPMIRENRACYNNTIETRGFFYFVPDLVILLSMKTNFCRKYLQKMQQVYIFLFKNTGFCFLFLLPLSRKHYPHRVNLLKDVKRVWDGWYEDRYFCPTGLFLVFF